VSFVPKNLGTNEAEAERSSPPAARASGSPPARPPAPRGSSGSEFSQRRKPHRNYISGVGTQPKEGDGDTRNVAWTSGRQAGVDWRRRSRSGDATQLWWRRKYIK